MHFGLWAGSWWISLLNPKYYCTLKNSQSTVKWRTFSFFCSIQWLFIFAESVFFGLVAFILLLDQIRGIFSDRTSTDKIKFENQSLPVTRQSSNKIFLLRRTFGNGKIYQNFEQSIKKSNSSSFFLGPTWLWIFPCDFNFYKSDEEVQKMFNIWAFLSFCKPPISTLWPFTKIKEKNSLNFSLTLSFEFNWNLRRGAIRFD